MFWIFGKRGCLVGTVDLDECAAVLCGVGDGTKRRQQVGASGICPKLRIGMGGFVGSVVLDAPRRRRTIADGHKIEKCSSAQ